jgi:hypothetical protein
VDSVLPQFVASQPVTIPTINGKNSWPQPGPQSWPDWALNPQPLSRNYLTEYYSSYINTTGASLTTIKYDLDHYTGTLKVQAAQDYESIWVDVTESREYFDESGTFYINVVGFHPLLRLGINNSQGYGASATATVVDGVVTGIAVNNAGMGYMAAPYVQILGQRCWCHSHCRTIHRTQWYWTNHCHKWWIRLFALELWRHRRTSGHCVDHNWLRYQYLLSLSIAFA